MRDEKPMASPPRPAGVMRALNPLINVVHVILVLGGLTAIVYAAVPQIRAFSKPRPVELPHTMEAVNWASPDSSLYCLACHRQVAPAMAGRDVEQGHSQNVPLSEDQLEAVRAMGTVAGPGGTLICMSCHKLGNDEAGSHMLADTLADGAFCSRCHPGHYAQDTPHDLRVSAPHEQNRLGQTALEGGPCSACHLAHRYAREFEPCPLDPDGRCITCHQMYRCAANHPRMSMDHPESRCAECHDPHDMSHGEFLKAAPSQLCVSCHEQFGDGPAAGMHPVGPMDRPVPEEFVSAGAVITQPNELTCLVCHSTHTAGYGPLLTLDTQSNDACLTCHRDELAQQHPQGLLHKHAQQPALNDVQLQAVSDWNTTSGPGGELLCVSCHRVHGAERNAHLLAFRPEGNAACSTCHESQTAVVGTTHDLRTNFPGERNLADQTPLVGGPCSACHAGHGFARAAVPAPGDESGRCTTCHQDGSCGQTLLAGAPLHPDTTCAECHDPHEQRFGDYLAKPQAETCIACHADQALVAGGPHDASHDEEPWRSADAEPRGLCLTCHTAHGGEQPDLLRKRDANAPNPHDGACLACHADAAWNASTTIAAVHPRQVSIEHTHVDVTLIPSDEQGNKQLGCQTCHNPHGGPEPRNLARVDIDEPAEQLCLHCHKEKTLVRHTGHSAISLRRFGFEVDSCKPCHAMHAYPDSVWGEVLSPRFLMERCERVVGGVEVSCVPCLACHHPEGPAPVRDIATHPDVLMMNVIDPNAPGYLPLFGADGRVDRQGRVACRTCHLSHGRLDLLQRVEDDETLTEAEQGALRLQLRHFATPNVCSECHGPQARESFLHFHDMAWRARHRTAGP